MSTVKFAMQDELNELQAKIYLHTKKKMSKKEILELVFKMGQQDFEKIIEMIENGEKGDEPDDEFFKTWIDSPFTEGEPTDSVKEHDVVL